MPLSRPQPVIDASVLRGSDWMTNNRRLFLIAAMDEQWYIKSSIDLVIPTFDVMIERQISMSTVIWTNKGCFLGVVYKVVDARNSQSVEGVPPEYVKIEGMQQVGHSSAWIDWQPAQIRTLVDNEDE